MDAGASPRWLRPADHPESLWANGLGSTRELARDPDGRWRLSLADLTEDAPFSSFPGIDRLFIVVDGQVNLRIDGVWSTLKTGDAIEFPGEAEVFADVEQPARAANLMIRRGTFHLEHRSHSGISGLELTGDEFLILTAPAQTADGIDLETGSAFLPQLSGPSTINFSAPTAVQRIHLISGSGAIG